MDNKNPPRIFKSIGKRGATYNALELIRYAVLTAIVVVAVVAFVNVVITVSSETRAAQLVIYDNLLLYTPGGFHISDAKTGRSIPLSVDLAHFDEATINKMLGHPDNKFVGGLLQVTDEVTGRTTRAYWNKAWYDTYKPLTKNTGSGSALSKVFQHQVILKTEDGTHPGHLIVELVVPR